MNSLRVPSAFMISAEMKWRNSQRKFRSVCRFLENNISQIFLDSLESIDFVNNFRLVAVKIFSQLLLIVL